MEVNPQHSTWNEGMEVLLLKINSESVVLGEVGLFSHSNTALQVPWKAVWMTDLEVFRTCLGKALSSLTRLLMLCTGGWTR